MKKTKNEESSGKKKKKILFSRHSPETVTSHRAPRPRRILLVRHGQSVGNVDEREYVTSPDWSLRLTEKGDKQAEEVGRKIAHLLRDEKRETQRQQMVFSYVSPYVRTMDTLSGALRGIDEVDGGEAISLLGVREEPRLVEQQ